MRGKRIFRVAAAFFVALFLLCPLAGVSASALEQPQIERVGAAYLYNVENDRVLFEQDADKVVFPAASVKVMTAVVAYEALSSRMGENVVITSEMIAGAVGNHIGIKAGEHIFVRDLFYALLLKGANDASYVLACLAYGSVDAFVGKMNERAESLGMTSTVYKNPTGMHDADMVTTARDTSLVARTFASYPELIEMSSVTKHVIEKSANCTERNLYNRNAFVSKLNSLGTKEYYYPDAKGMNFGSTKEGGDSFVTMAEREGLRYIVVILGGEENEDETEIYAFKAAGALCDYALDGFGYVKVLTRDKLVYDMPVSLSEETDHVMLIPGEEVKAYLPKEVDPKTEITCSYTLEYDSLQAPVAEGQKVGYVSVYYGDELLGTVELVTQNEVKLSTFLSMLESIRRFTESKFFICSVIALVVLTVGFVLINSAYRGHRQRRRAGARYNKFR